MDTSMMTWLYDVTTLFLITSLGAITALAIWDCVAKNENAE